MAKKTKKERILEILDYRIDREKELAKNFKKFNISINKINKIEAKQARHEAKRAEVAAS